MTDTAVSAPYKLMRARKGRMLGGVAAGLAKSSGLDVTVVRICIGATVLTFGLGVPAYILMWVVLPEESPRRGRVIEPAPEHVARAIRVSIVVVAALSVLNQFNGFWPFSNPSADGFGWGGLVGLILLGIGVSVLFSRHRPDRTWWEPSSPPNSASTTVWRAPAPADDDDYAVDEAEEPPTYVGPFRDVMAPVADAMSKAWGEARITVTEARPTRPPRPPSAATHDRYADDVDDDYYDDYDYAPPPRAVATVVGSGTESSGGAALGWARVLGWFVLIWFTLASIVVTVAWLFGGLSITRPALLAVASWLVFTAVTNTLLHAKFARAILPTLALVLIPIVIGGATIRPVGAIGHHIEDPRSVEVSELNFRQSVGRLDLNYGRTDFDRDTTINARVGIGALFVEVPDDATVKVAARGRFGGYEIFGRTSDGTRGRLQDTFKGCPDGPVLTLNVRSGIGFIEVHRDSRKRAPTCKKAA